MCVCVYVCWCWFVFVCLLACLVAYLSVFFFYDTNLNQVRSAKWWRTTRRRRRRRKRKKINIKKKKTDLLSIQLFIHFFFCFIFSTSKEIPSRIHDEIVPRARNFKQILDRFQVTLKCILKMKQNKKENSSIYFSTSFFLISISFIVSTIILIVNGLFCYSAI